MRTPRSTPSPRRRWWTWKPPGTRLGPLQRPTDPARLMTDPVQSATPSVSTRVERRKALRYALKVEGNAWSVARVAAEPFKVTVSDISIVGMMLHTGSDELGRFAPGDELL